MRKLHLAAVLVATSSFLLFIQIFILQLLTGKDTEVNNEPNVVLEAVQAVAASGAKHGFSMFLIDPFILSNIYNGSKIGRDNRCRILCLGQRVTHFGTLGQLSTQTQKERFLNELKEIGAKVLVFDGDNPILIRHELKVQIPLHYIIIIYQHLIHIVVFYDRGNQYWWHGPLHLIGAQSKEVEGFKIQDCKFSQQAGSYENFIDTEVNNEPNVVLERFLNELKEIGAKVLVFDGDNPILIRHELKVQIPLHYIIIIYQHLIHIVVFYDRGNQYWWHGPLHLIGAQSKEVEGFKIQDCKFSQQAGSYEKVEISPVVIDNIKLHFPNKFSFIAPASSTKFIECNYIRSKLFYEKYGRDESEDAELFRTKAWKLLSKAKTLLDHLNIPFWLSSGTCLGYFRQCDFIPYSKDVDIGIWIKDYNPDIIPAFSTHDLPLTHSFGKIEDSFELSFRDNDIKLDVFFFYEERDYVWNGGTQARTGKKFKYIFPKFELCWTEFLELKIRVPCQTEDYIQANYGPNWFEPVKNWDWKKSPPNVEENGQWPIEDWPDVIQLIPIPEQT
ncbi:fukutin-like [Centruroides sculpturatus]|uniref:fukutin-like n=1 Tax=Centruroides sculpturatus TaxID=218467 RepID=UPI000C6CBF88|nr:fukutin-like [Centruroides sculpturatus]